MWFRRVSIGSEQHWIQLYNISIKWIFNTASICLLSNYVLNTSTNKNNNKTYKPPVSRSNSKTKQGRLRTSRLLPVLIFVCLIVTKSNSYWYCPITKQQASQQSARNLDSNTSWYGGFASWQTEMTSKPTETTVLDCGLCWFRSQKKHRN